MDNDNLTTMIPWTTTSWENSTDLLPDARSNPCALETLLVAGYLLLAMSVFGLLGNVITIVIMWPGRGKTSINVILMFLAMLDIVILVVWCLMKTVPAFCMYYCSDDGHSSYMLHIHPYLIVYTWPVGSFAIMCETWTIVLVALHRYMAVCVPHKAKSWCQPKVAQKQMAGIALASAAFYIPTFWGMTVVENSAVAGGFKAVPSTFGTSFGYVVVYRVIFSNLLLYALPFGLLIFVTVKLVIVLDEVRKRRQRLGRKKQEENGITLSLVIVVVIFMVCHLASPVREIIYAVVKDTSMSCGSVYYLYALSASVVLVFNSSINCVVYCVTGPPFRRQAMRLLSAFIPRILPKPTSDAVDRPGSYIHHGETHSAQQNVSLMKMQTVSLA